MLYSRSAYFATEIALSILSLPGSGRPTSGLNPRTHTITLAFTTPSLSVDERAAYRYTLDGIDGDWLNVGSPGRASLANLQPGSCCFKAIAATEDGIKSNVESHRLVYLATAHYRTLTFHVLSVGVLWMFYRFRLRAATERARRLLVERLSERERIARELHDTLLQGVQGLILLFDGISAQIPQDTLLASKIDSAIDRAERLMAEGRDRVRDLQSPMFDLLTAFQELANDLDRHGDTAYEVRQSGRPRDLQLLVCDEVFKIGREAVIRAFQHDSARSIVVELVYRRFSLDLTVRDDGMGMRESLLAEGREGRRGVKGMRDQAKKLHATLRIRSQEPSGTKIDLSVPAGVAYVPQQSASVRVLTRLRNILQGRRI